MLQFSDILAFLTIGFIIYLWWHLLGLRQIALEACKANCIKHDLQLLDETVGLSRLWFKRNSHSHLLWSSKFVFEFTSSGVDRYKGQIELLGQHIENVTLEPYRIQ